MNNIKAYTEPILQMFGKFGKALVHLFKGEFGQAWDTAKGAKANTLIAPSTNAITCCLAGTKTFLRK